MLNSYTPATGPDEPQIQRGPPQLRAQEIRESSPLVEVIEVVVVHDQPAQEHWGLVLVRDPLQGLQGQIALATGGIESRREKIVT